MLDVPGEENSVVNACACIIITYIHAHVVVKNVHTPCITSIHRRTDSKLESLLHIIETKRVCKFDMLYVLGEENSMVNTCACTIPVQ